MYNQYLLYALDQSMNVLVIRLTIHHYAPFSIRRATGLTKLARLDRPVSITYDIKFHCGMLSYH